MTKIKLNTNLIPIFCGTYESKWDIAYYADSGDELAVEYTHDDLMKGIVSVYADESDYILKEFNLEFINGIKFSGDYNSPREYNFSTDRIDFTLDIDYELMLETARALIGDDKYEAWLKEHYTSYDGFWSYTPNTSKGIVEAIEGKKYEYHQAVGALITYLTGMKTIRDIEYMVHDTWQGNGYGGTDYKVVGDEQDDRLENE